ncbi:MAG TPA: AraC family transcriptional regulator [Bryobacteraceae bacterium]|nr:AraC family transcriptional regulator [Bryobacteraceae bacterium]
MASSTDRLVVRIQSDPAGVVDGPARPHPVVVIHVGPSVNVACRRGERYHSGMAVHGDVDIIPAGTASRWELRQRDTALIVGVPSGLLRVAAAGLNRDPARAEVVNRFQLRDPQIEQIGWALKTEMETEYRNGRLYLDSLGAALAAHLLEYYSPDVRGVRAIRGGLSGRRLKELISYIEDNLSRDLSLPEIAKVAGLSVSHCKAAFRASVGRPIHQYVLCRRVERAQALLREGELSVRQVALEAGFAHQSHLAYHMRRVVGVTPKEFRSGSVS